MTSPVAIVMGSQSDWATLRHAADLLEKLEVESDCRIVSAHRTPERLFEFATGAADEGFRVIIAGAGGAAHLPGMVAALTHLPVLGVPVQSQALRGLDSLLSIVQMPAGVPVGTLAIGEAGATNAGLLAASILALDDAELAERLKTFRAEQTSAVAEAPASEPPAPPAAPQPPPPLQPPTPLQRPEASDPGRNPDERFAPGGDAQAVRRIAVELYGGYEPMFEAHGWPERGSEMLRKVQARVKEHYGSVAAFVDHHRARRAEPKARIRDELDAPT